MRLLRYQNAKSYLEGGKQVCRVVRFSLCVNIALALILVWFLALAWSWVTAIVLGELLQVVDSSL